MFQPASSQSTIGAKTIVVSLETTSVETRREPAQPADASGSPSARRKNGWSYYVFRRELRTMLERGRERAIRVGGTSFLL
ncbi:MAG: hypothetical protein WCB27_06085 [Thermoguttaceae bacterium]|jgi:hypothetical protein